MSRKVYRFVPGSGDKDIRIDQYIPSQTGELSRTLLRKVIDLGGVQIGGRRVRKCSYPVKPGEQVEVFLDGLPIRPFSIEQADVLYRDKYLLALNKAAGIETQPTPARYKGTLYEALLRFLQDPFRPLDRPELGMAQRLDRDTSGVIVFSIHSRAHKGLTEAFAGRTAEKSYLALVEGILLEKEGEFRSLLARNRATNLVKSVARGGKEAITLYKVVEEFVGASLVEVRILTGRSHQIRVHFSEAGHPLLGDTRYGGPRFYQGREVKRQMLHSRSLSLPHPLGGENLDLQAPLPQDMEKLLSYLRPVNPLDESLKADLLTPSPQS